MRLVHIGSRVAALALAAGSIGSGVAVLAAVGTGVASATTPLACPPAVVSGSTATVTCSYNGTTGADGSAQTWTVPSGVTQATFDVRGAQGGSSPGGQGGEAEGTLTVLPGTTLQVNVGGDPTGAAGGFNGGGQAGNGSASGGGGASDVRGGSYGLADRLIVAGGGGGTSIYPADPAGAGGGSSGTPSACDPGYAGLCATGGTSSAGGTPGQNYECFDLSITSPPTVTAPMSGSSGAGGNGGLVTCTYLTSPTTTITSSQGAGGGGGGWFGGGGGGAIVGGVGFFGGFGGGGSGYVDPIATNANMQTGVNSGNGQVIITYAVPGGPIHITTTSLPDATVGQPYSFQLQATGGIPPYTWNKYKPKGSGALPWHVTLSRSGLISGTPKHAGTYTIIIKCLDSTLSHKTQAVQTLTLTVNP